MTAGKKKYLSRQQIKQAIVNAPLGPKDRVYQNARTRGQQPGRNNAEYRLIDSLDNKRLLERVAPLLEKLETGKIDVGGLFHGISPQIATQVIRIALAGESEKNRLEASRHLLALAGHNPSQKHEIARVDPATPRDALISLIAGASKDLKEEGIEVVDDRPIPEADSADQ